MEPMEPMELWLPECADFESKTISSNPVLLSMLPFLLSDLILYLLRSGEDCGAWKY